MPVIFGTILYFAMVLFTRLFAEAPILIFDPDKKATPLHSYMEYIPDPNGTLQLTDIINNKSDWKDLLDNPRVNFGYSPNYYWIRFTIMNNSQTKYSPILELGFSRQDWISFYYTDEFGKFLVYETGDMNVFSKREIKDSAFAFYLHLEPERKQTYYIRTCSIYNRSILNPSLILPTEFQERTNYRNLLNGVLYGTLGILIFYNLLLFLFIRDKIYLYYSLSNFCFLFLVMGIHGTAFQYIYPENIWLQNRDYLISGSLGTCFIFLFTDKYLDFKTYIPKLHKVRIHLISLLLFQMILNCLFIEFYSNLIFELFVVTIIICLIILISASIYLSFQKLRVAYFYVGSFVLFFLTLLYSLFTVNFLTPANSSSYWSFQIGFSIMLIFLALGTADRIQLLQNSLKSVNENLELKVENRAGELQRALLTLNNDLKTAKKIQSNLLPPANLHIDKAWFDVAYLPLEQVGGDIYDIFQMEDGIIRVFLADATGHGVQAALMTMSIYSEYQRIKKYPLHVSDILAILNQQYYYRYYFLNTYFTCILVDIDLLNQKVSYASAGHPTQYIFANDNILEMHTTGKLMGVINNISYK